MCGTELLYAVDELCLNGREVLEVLTVGTDSRIQVGWDGVQSCVLNGFVDIAADPGLGGYGGQQDLFTMVEDGVCDKQIC